MVATFDAVFTNSPTETCRALTWPAKGARIVVSSIAFRALATWASAWATEASATATCVVSCSKLLREMSPLLTSSALRVTSALARCACACACSSDASACLSLQDGVAIVEAREDLTGLHRVAHVDGRVNHLAGDLGGDVGGLVGDERACGPDEQGDVARSGRLRRD